jgi:tetratricopeptide (TPR) repeat protein
MAEVKLEDAPEGVRTFYDKGIAAMERANLDYAMDMFEAALQIEPRLLQVRRLLRAAAVQQQKDRPPGKLAALKGLGGLARLAARKKANPIEALAAAEKLARSDPFNLQVAKALCSAAVAAELPEAAIQHLEILKDHRPDELAVLEPLADLYRDGGLYRLEYECRSRIARLKPNDSAATKALKDAAAHNTMEQAGWDKAESYRDVMKSPAAPPRDDTIKDGIGHAVKQLENDPANLNARLALSDLYLRARQFSEAVETLEAGIRTAGGADPRLERALADARVAQMDDEIGQAEEAGDTVHASRLRKKMAGARIEEAAERVRHYPNDLQLKFEYGQLLFEHERYTEAIQQFQLAQRNPQRRVRSLFFLAQAFRNKGQLDIAREQFETARRELAVMDDTKKEIVYELGTLCETMNDTAYAVQCFKEIYAVDIGYRDVAVKIEQTYRT